MITKYKYKSTQPYSLHDMVVNKITHTKDSIQLIFDEGYESMQEPYQQIKGNINIQGVDFDFVSVLLLSKNGKYGKFQGYKLSLDHFFEKFKTYAFEIVDELYGYNMVEYSGFLSTPDCEDFIELSLSIYHFGDIVYETEEEI